MKNVRKTIVIVAATIVITLFVTETATPERPITTQARTCRAIQITSSTTPTAITSSRIRKIVRGRKSTVRSVVTRRGSLRRRTLLALRIVTLRAAPVVEHASLPGGGSVTIWVGVPDDPYIDDKRQLHNVDLQLHEGGSVV